MPFLITLTSALNVTKNLLTLLKLTTYCKKGEYYGYR
jgi:hypothetical protein